MGDKLPPIKPNECCKLHQQLLYLLVSSGIIERGILFFVTEGVIGADCKLSLATKEQAPMPKSVLTGVLQEDFNKENCYNNIVLPSA